MKRKAAERNCAIAGSVAVCENGNYYNRFYFVHPDGAVQHYDLSLIHISMKNSNVL